MWAVVVVEVLPLLELEGEDLGVVDLDARTSIAYVMNRMDSELTGDQRGKNIRHRLLGLLREAEA